MFAIALDGPAGAGKSTIAKMAATRLGMHYVDTGAMYRTLAYDMLRRHVDIHQENAVACALEQIQMKIIYDENVQRMFLGEEEVTDQIRTPEVGEATSTIAVYRAVRDKLLTVQRDLAQKYEVIMDGRDIGTTILPDAPLKVFLTADAAERGKRRFLELEEKEPGMHTLEKTIRAIKERDERDMNREIAPLRQAADAVVLDTTYMTAQQAADALVQMAQEARSR